MQTDQILLLRSISFLFCGSIKQGLYQLRCIILDTAWKKVFAPWDCVTHSMQASAWETLLLIIEMLSLLSTLAALLRQRKIIHPTSYPNASGLAPINKSLSPCAWNSCWWLPSSRGDRNTSGVCRAAKKQRGDEPRQPSLVHTAASAQPCCCTWEPWLSGAGRLFGGAGKHRGCFSSFIFPHCGWTIWLCLLCGVHCSHSSTFLMIVLKRWPRWPKFSCL